MQNTVFYNCRNQFVWLKMNYCLIILVSLFIVYLVIFSMFLRKSQTPFFEVSKFESEFGIKNDLDGCYHVYLDVGSNVGIQVRKLFEPEMYPGSQVLQIFDQYFGNLSKDGLRGGQKICAVGFEPNPHHTKTLQEVQRSHQDCGWMTHFYTETAAAHDYGTVDFITDNDEGNLEWGASIVSNQRKHNGTKMGKVKKIRLADYIWERVSKRMLPNTGAEGSQVNPATVLMKLDIEGSELEVLTDLIVSGAMQHINFAFVEFHPGSFKPKESRHKRLNELRDIAAWFSEVTHVFNLTSKVKIDTMDDESFYKSNFPLSDCKN